MRFVLKALFPDLTDFTVAIFKIPQILKHFRLCFTGIKFQINQTVVTMFSRARAKSLPPKLTKSQNAEGYQLTKSQNAEDYRIKEHVLAKSVTNTEVNYPAL